MATGPFVNIRVCCSSHVVLFFLVEKFRCFFLSRRNQARPDIDLIAAYCTLETVAVWWFHNMISSYFFTVHLNTDLTDLFRVHYCLDFSHVLFGKIIPQEHSAHCCIRAIFVQLKVASGACPHSWDCSSRRYHLSSSGKDYSWPRLRSFLSLILHCITLAWKIVVSHDKITWKHGAVWGESFGTGRWARDFGKFSRFHPVFFEILLGIFGCIRSLSH